MTLNFIFDIWTRLASHTQQRLAPPSKDTSLGLNTPAIREFSKGNTEIQGFGKKTQARYPLGPTSSAGPNSPAPCWSVQWPVFYSPESFCSCSVSGAVTSPAACYHLASGSADTEYTKNTECTEIQNAYKYWNYRNTECIQILNVQKYRMHTITECTELQNAYKYWMYRNTECIQILNVYKGWNT